jgi:hypothetical protein
MKDSILNSVLIAVTFAAIVYSAIGDLGQTPQTATAQAGRAVTTEKTIVAAKRLPAELTPAAATVAVAPSAVSLVASTAR